ncbi:MAG: hypothetical protein Q4C50_08325, partial [Eubacteriales bacterium]|nr:hypothetical protein [Eubacteriales bacterium]
MNKFGKRIVLAGICTGLAAFALTGCSNVNKSDVVATIDGDAEITLGVAGFMLRYNQIGMESFASALMGQTDIWSQTISDSDGTEITYGESFKQEMLDDVKEMMILEQHASEYGVELTGEEQEKIAAAAKAFVESNDQKTLDAMYADEESVARVLTLYTIQEKMQAAIKEGADKEVSDEEAAQKTIEYVTFSTAGTTDDEGNTVELTEEEKEAVKAQAQQVIDAVKGGKTLEEAAKEIDENKTVLSSSYGTDDTILDDKLKEAADALEDGELAEEPVELDSAYYVVQMKSTFDEEATETRKQTIITKRENDLYDEVLAGWEPESFEIQQKLWDKVTFADSFSVKQTEAAETEAAAESETQTETETVAES